MPSAPKRRPSRAASGVSALARTPSRRSSSAHSSTVLNWSLISGSTSGTSSTVTWPVVPSMAIRSPGRDRGVAHAAVPADRSISSSLAPHTHGRPMPRATSAACEALPPSLVRMPFAAWKPATSSASVNGRTRTTSRPSASASHRLRGGEHHLALGGAGRRVHAGGQHLVVGVGVEGRVQQRVQRRRVDGQQRLRAREQALVDGVDREPHRGLRGPLGVARLEHEQRALLDGELGVLHVAVVALQRPQDVHQLGVGVGQHVRQLGDVARVAHARTPRPRPGRSPGSRRWARAPRSPRRG